MADDPIDVRRGWIHVNGSREDDGTIRLGTGQELRFSPAEALAERRNVPGMSGAIWKASVQRLAFWRR
jgi:hypothetical protein